LTVYYNIFSSIDLSGISLDCSNNFYASSEKDFLLEETNSPLLNATY